MSLYIITGNEHKFREFKELIPDISRLDMDLLEIQGIDPREIIRHKLSSAFTHVDEGIELLVEDTSLHMTALQGLPGPLIRWFLETIGKEGLYDISQRLGNDRAEGRCMIGYAPHKEEMCFFEGVVHGRIVSPRGEGGFHWDKIFVPDGYSRTFAEMTLEEKNAISHRRQAIDQLKKFLDARRGIEQ